MKNKIAIIFRREYLTTVKSKSFLLMTLLVPISIALFSVVIGVLMTYEGDDSKTVMIVDESNVLNKKLKDQKNFFFTFSEENVDQLIEEKDKNWDVLLHIPAINNLQKKNFDFNCYSEKALDFQKTLDLKSIITKKVRDYKIRQLNIPDEYLESLQTNVAITSVPLDKEEKESGFLQSGIASIFGFAVGYIMFFMILFNGTLVFQSVIQEKTNRIVEVMISTVKPFQLMFGKIFAAVCVGLTQMLIWIALGAVIFTILFTVFGFDASQMSEAQTQAQIDALQLGDMEEMVYKVGMEFQKINWAKGIFTLIIFFLGGYMLYASLFAALGALAGDDLQQSNQLTIPATLLLALGIYLIFPVVRAPDSTLALWAPLVPFFAPVLMPALTFMEIPLWRYLLSLFVLIGSTVLITWIAAKIYRFGILMYGKRVTFKQVMQYLFSK